MFLIERSAPTPRPRPQAALRAPLDGVASVGAFELFPGHFFPGSGDLVRMALPDPVSAQRGPAVPVSPRPQDLAAEPALPPRQTRRRAG